MWLGPSLPRARVVLSAGTWTADAGTECITLDFDARHRRRMRMTGDHGTVFLLDLAQATLLRDGDGLLLDDGRRIRVVAAAERLIEARCATLEDLARIAWHLGNRHLAVQFAAGVVRLRDDYVIADMLRQMGAEVTAVNMPFNPESGAYGAGGHAHHAGEGRGHRHD